MESLAHIGSIAAMHNRGSDFLHARGAVARHPASRPATWPFEWTTYLCNQLLPDSVWACKAHKSSRCELILVDTLMLGDFQPVLARFRAHPGKSVMLGAISRQFRREYSAALRLGSECRWLGAGSPAVGSCNVARYIDGVFR